MAKPQSGIAGSGMHFHISVCDSSKKDGAKKYRLADDKTLAAATAGVLQIMNEAAIFFMPFGNSYRRFLPGQYAPMSVCWGDNNRAAAVRLPLADSPSAKRLEVRAAGADANPYLAAAAALAGMHWGMKKKTFAAAGNETGGGADSDLACGAGKSVVGVGAAPLY